MMVLPFRALALGPGKLRLQDAGAIDSLSQKTQLGIIRRARHRWRCIADKVEAGIVPDFLQRDPLMQRTATHPFARQLELKHAQGRQYERRPAIRQAAIRPRGSAIAIPRSTKNVDALHLTRPVLPLPQDVKAAR